MFWHVLLGLLHDGTPRHGYELGMLYRKRSGTQLSAGNFYRELARLSRDGLVEAVTRPRDSDTRRIPYGITERGRRKFDEWLLGTARENDDLTEWILFADRVPPDVRKRILERRLEDLWVRNKRLARIREDAVGSSETYDPLPALIAREMKQVSAEIEFLEEFREQLAGWDARASDDGATASGAGRGGPLVRTTTRPRRRAGGR